MSTINTPDVRHWTAVCQAARQTQFLKRASGQEVPFEQGFANLAHAVLKGKAPQLLDHQLGFQLIEKSDDNNFAVGVFAFDLNGQLAYGPVIFNGGKLKGTELIYLTDADLFLPMQEPWINYLLRKRTASMGKGVSRNMDGRGVAKPDVVRMRQSPYKFASAAFSTECLDKMAAAVRKSCNGPLRVPALLKESGAASKTFLEMIVSCPGLLEPVLAVYGQDVMKTAMESAKRADTLLDMDTPVHQPSLLDGLLPEKPQTKVRAHVKLAADMSMEDRQTLRRDGVVFRDNRQPEEVSKLLILDDAAIKLATAPSLPEPKRLPTLTAMTPAESGVYELVTKPDTLTECVVLTSPRGRHGREEDAVIMVRDNMKRWTRRPPGELFALMKMDSGAISGWFNSLESATPKEDGKYLCVSRTGVATTPFVVERKESDDCYAVYFPYHSCCCNEPFGQTDQSRLQRERTEVKSISLGWSEGTKEYVQGGVLYVPKAWKVIELEAPRKQDKDGYSISDVEKEDPLTPGTFFDLKLEVFNKTAKLAIDNDGIQVSVNDKRMSPVDAMVSLVCEHGLTEQMAKTAIAEADIARRRHQEPPGYRIKYAAPFPMFREGPNAPSFDDDAFTTSDPIFGSGRPAITSAPQRQLVPGMEGKMREPINREPLPGPPSVEDVMGAAQSGKREVFDTSLLSSLVDSTQRESLVDRNLDDMIKGLDRTGRTLFSFYTHPEEFEEEFGASDMTEIEDGLRNAFDASGKIVLKLKQQSADPAMLGQVEPDIGTFN